MIDGFSPESYHDMFLSLIHGCEMDFNVDGFAETLSCPASGRPVRFFAGHRAERQGGNAYRLAFCLIGDDIVYVRSIGRVEIDDTRKYLEFMDRIGREWMPPDRHFLVVDDYTQLQGTSFEAKKLYADAMRRNPRIRGVIYCGASPFMALVIRLGRMLAKPAFPVLIATDYAEAMRLAVGDTLRLARVLDEDASVNRAGRARETRSEWADAFPDFCQRLEILERDVLYVEASGMFRMDHLNPSAERIRSVFTERDPRFIVFNWTHLEGVDRDAARAFIETLNAVRAEIPIRMVIVYGLNPLVRMIFNLYRSFSLYPLESANTLSEALLMISAERTHAGIPETVSAAASFAAMRDFVGSIRFDKPGMDFVMPRVSENDPARIFYDSIAMLKGDFDLVYADRTASEARIRAMLDGLPFMAWLVDENHGLIAANSHFLKLAGSTGDALFGVSIELYLPGEMGASWLAHEKIARESETAAMWEQHFAGTLSERWNEMFVAPVYGENGRCIGAAGFARDISARKLAEQELLRARVAAEAAGMMKTQFLARMSHELRTPMNGVMAMGSLLADSELSLEQRDYVSAIESSAQILLGIIGDIFDFSRTDKPSLVTPSADVGDRAVAEASVPLPIPEPVGVGLELPSTKTTARILLVEDNPTNRRVATMLLSKLGYGVDVAVNGLEAVQILEATPYDLVLMDIQMPEMDGYEATRSIRSGGVMIENAAVTIIALTANAIEGDREKCLAAGMNDYLAKPVRMETLRNTLNTWLP